MQKNEEVVLLTSICVIKIKATLSLFIVMASFFPPLPNL